MKKLKVISMLNLFLLCLCFGQLSGQNIVEKLTHYNFHNSTDFNLVVIEGKMPEGVMTWQSHSRGDIELGIIMEESADVKISVYDDNEELKVVLVDGFLEAGTHPYDWNNENDLSEIIIVYECDDHTSRHFIEIDNGSSILNKLFGWLF